MLTAHRKVAICIRRSTTKQPLLTDKKGPAQDTSSEPLQRPELPVCLFIDIIHLRRFTYKSLKLSIPSWWIRIAYNIGLGKYNRIVQGNVQLSIVFIPFSCSFGSVSYLYFESEAAQTFISNVVNQSAYSDSPFVIALLRQCAFVFACDLRKATKSRLRAHQSI